jgi:uroporphyrin-III C-methyltransferase
MTRTGDMHASRTADTEVFYMAGKQLAALSARLLAAGWPQDTPVSVVSRAGWPDSLHSDHSVVTLAEASALHADRPAVVTVGAGARPIHRTADIGRAQHPAVKSLASPHGDAPSTSSTDSEP